MPKHVSDEEKLCSVTVALTRKEIEQLGALALVAGRSRGEELRRAVRYYLDRLTNGR